MRTPRPIKEINSWRAVDPKLMLDKLERLKKNRSPLNAGARWVFRTTFSPVDLYVYLKARFGAPNGMQMIFKSPTSDNLVHWHWTIQMGNRVMDFMGFNMHAEVSIEGYKKLSIAQGIAFEDGLKDDFKNYGKEMSEVRRQLEKWNIFVNPYRRIHKVIEDFATRLRNLSLQDVELPQQPTTSEELQQFKPKFEECAKIYREALGLSTSIRMLAPVLAEAFINLTIFLLAKPEIKKDSRIYQDILRREIDVRVKSLHINCVGFKNAVSSDTDQFRNFHTLMNGRNDFLHGNIDPTRLAYEVIYFDANIPLPKTYKNFSELALVNSLIHVEPEKALNDLKIVEEFVQFVLAQLKDDTANMVRMFMQTIDPGWREDTMRAGILFPPYTIHAVFGPEKEKPTGQ